MKSSPREVQNTIFDGTETEIKLKISLDTPVTITLAGELYVTGNFDPNK